MVFTRLLRARRDGSRSEAGVAMIIAVVVVMLLAIIPIAVWLQAQQQLPLARHDQDHESALAAAEAGVDDYLNHLAQNSNYWTYNKSNLPSDGNQAFTNWVAVPGPNDNNEYFRYAPDTSQTASSGIVYLTSSGKANNVVRTVKVGLRRQGFLDYLWLTDYEIIDPALSGDDSSCKLYSWQRRGTSGSNYGPDPSNCSIVYWTNTANLVGPVHTNDGLYVCGSPFFNGETDTYYNSPKANSAADGSTKFGGPGVVLNPKSCTNTPTFSPNTPAHPLSGSILPFPPRNDSIKTQADKSQGGTGCLYTGPTTIKLNSNGTMDVTSPATKTGNADFNAPACSPGTGKSLPADGVIYVQNVPASGPDSSSCSGSNCDGDVSLSGTLKGQLTIAVEDDIIITGNVTYNTWPGGNDVLGLIADNDIAVYHPVTSGGANGSGTVKNLTIDAAMLALNHSFYVQNWMCPNPNGNCSQGKSASDPLGKLTVNGVIAQEYRGAVGTFDSSGNTVSGYDKAYTYDSRLKYLSPPYFLSPTQSAWGRVSYAEIKPNSAP